MEKQMTLWFHACRPKTLFLGLFPIILGSALASKVDSFCLIKALLSLLGALLIQIGTNLSNDYFDFTSKVDTASRKGSFKVLQQGLITPKAMKKAFLWCFILAALLGLIVAYSMPIMHGMGFFSIVTISILFSLLYTAPPFPLSHYGLGDIFVLIFYGPITTLTTYFLQTGSIDFTHLLISFIPGIRGLAPLTLNNLRDHDEDRLANKKTLIVRFGEKFGQVYFFITLISLVIFPCISLRSALGIIPSFALVPFLLNLKILLNKEDKKQLQILFVLFGKSLPFYITIFCILVFFYA